MHEFSAKSAATNRWSLRSLAILFLAWLVLQIGGLFSPGLLDDVDSIYIEISREMLRRHDFVTPYIDGIRFFDKPPLMYWMAAGSMHLFGVHVWAARLPLALAVLALLLAVYGLGIRLFAALSPVHYPDRAGFYAALALATSIGPYLYTRFFIPDILLCLWMTLAVHLFLIALERVATPSSPANRWSINTPERDATVDPISSSPPKSGKSLVRTFGHWLSGASSSALVPCLAFAAVLAVNVLTKGLIGLVFPLGFVLLYLAITQQMRLLLRLHVLPSIAFFLALAAPWHILAALRSPAIALPPGLGLPATGGWAWFYLYNEHIARFLSKRIPHDYGQTPVWLFWLYLIIWFMPWTTFLPAALRLFLPKLSSRSAASAAERGTVLSLTLWTVVVVGFFTISARQEYYSLPALPALALLTGAILARADAARTSVVGRSLLRWHLAFLLPLATLVTFVCAYFAVEAPHPPPGTELSTLLAANSGVYNLSLSHLFDLTGAAMGLFRGPLTVVAFSITGVGLGSYLLRRRGATYAANLTLAAAMVLTLVAAHNGLSRFYPILGSKDLALAITQAQQASRRPSTGPEDMILIDGELTSGSSLIFYTGQQVHLLNGRVNGPWYGSFWPDALPIFESESTLRQLWSSRRRIFLFTYNPAVRTRELKPLAPVHTLASAGGKTILTNCVPIIQ